MRERSHALLEHGLAGRLEHFTIDLDRLGAAADEVVATIRQNYPTLEIPFHARWRHFSAGGLDRWGSIVPMAPWMDAAGMARAAFDLAIVSVLLDAGAGPDWRYEEDRTGETFSRSEGLAVASFEMFISGAFSSRPDDPFRVDAEALIALTPQELASGFQAGPQNPLLGIEGRARLLNRLGRVVAEHPETFGRADSPRPGGLFDLLAAKAQGGIVSAPRHPRRDPAASRRDLAGAHHARRLRSRRHLALSARGARARRRPTRRMVWCRSTSSRSGLPTR